MASGTVRVRIAGQTDVGLVREHNEDSFLIVDLDQGVSRPSLLRNYELGEQGVLLLVCDGMGGAAAGEVASNMAVHGMRRVLLREVGLDPDAPEPLDPTSSSVTAPVPPAATAAEPSVAISVGEMDVVGERERSTSFPVTAEPATAGEGKVEAAPTSEGKVEAAGEGKVEAAPTSDAKAEPAGEAKAAPTSDAKAAPTSEPTGEGKAEPAKAEPAVVVESAAPPAAEATPDDSRGAAAAHAIVHASPTASGRLSEADTGELPGESSGADVLVIDEALLLQARTLRNAVYGVNLEIFEAACADMAKAGMGTTLTAVWLRRRRLVVAQVGDSRAYLWRSGTLVQVTHDQSLVNQLLDSGQITPEQAKLFEHSNVILQALGVQEDVEVLVSNEVLRQGDRVLVCSDGLVGVVSDEEIQEVMGISDSLDDTAQTLIDLARAAGGPDNITVILAQVNGDLPSPRPEDEVLYRPMTLDPPPRAARTAEDLELSAERFGAILGGPASAPPPLSLWAVLSMAWVLGLLVAGLVVGILLYPRVVPQKPVPRGAQCYFKADRPGLDILVDGDVRAKTESPGRLVPLAPGQYRVALRDSTGPQVLLGEEQPLLVTPGQRCAVRLRTPAQPIGPLGEVPAIPAASPDGGAMAGGSVGSGGVGSGGGSGMAERPPTLPLPGEAATPPAPTVAPERVAPEPERVAAPPVREPERVAAPPVREPEAAIGNRAAPAVKATPSKAAAGKDKDHRHPTARHGKTPKVEGAPGATPAVDGSKPATDEKAEPKTEKAEPKADEKAEPKTEKAEPKTEKVEPKAEKAEPKTEKAEPKTEKAEPKTE